MRKSHDRARIAARVSATPSTNPCTLLIPAPGQNMAYAGRARKSPRMTATQRNSAGRVSEWSRSPYFWTDSAWSA